MALQRPFSNLIFATGVNFILATAALFLFFHSGLRYFGIYVPVTPHGAQGVPQVKLSKSSQEFQITIKVLTFNRLESLSRCLESLGKADYVGDSVKLHIFVDHFEIEESSIVGRASRQPELRKNMISSESGGSTKLKLRVLLDGYDETHDGSKFLHMKTGSAGTPRKLYTEIDSIDQKLKEAHEILHFIDGFNWPYGPKEVHYRTQNAGLQRQWLEAWWPATDNEFAFIVEDDMQLSPLFYRYMRKVVTTYYFDPANYDPSVYGISLQRPRFVPGKRGNLLQVNNSTRLFLYQMVGTWGQLLFPKPWKEFRLWYDNCKSKGVKPFLEGMVTTGWYVRLGEKIWTPWFTKFVHSKGYYNLYTNFLNERALSISYRDVGVNARRKAGPDSSLIDANGTSDINLWEMKPLKELKRYNYCFQEVLPRRPITTFDELKWSLPLLQRGGEVILVNTLGLAEELVKNWLCQFNKLGFKHYLLLAEEGKLSEDLLRKGHPVMHADSSDFVDTWHESFQKVEDFLALKAVTWVLQVGYNVWLTKVDMLWVDDPFHHIPRLDADLFGIEGKDMIRTGLIYFRNSDKVIQLCRGIQEEIVGEVKPLNYEQHDLGLLLWQDLTKFQIKVQAVPAGLITDIRNSTKDESSNLSVTTPLLGGFQRTNLTSVVQTLKGLGLWMVDDDLACTGIFCQAKVKH